LTWAQLGLHVKPCGLLNVHGYFDSLIRFVDHAVQERFIEPANRGLLLVDDSPEALLDRLAAWQPPPVDKVAWATQRIRDS
jgi:predicted Rossmann-fold nucleotide-binding protein